MRAHAYFIMFWALMGLLGCSSTKQPQEKLLSFTPSRPPDNPGRLTHVVNALRLADTMKTEAIVWSQLDSLQAVNAALKNGERLGLEAADLVGALNKMKETQRAEKLQLAATQLAKQHDLLLALATSVAQQLPAIERLAKDSAYYSAYERDGSSAYIQKGCQQVADNTKQQEALMASWQKSKAACTLALPWQQQVDKTMAETIQASQAQLARLTKAYQTAKAKEDAETLAEAQKKAAWEKEWAEIEKVRIEAKKIEALPRQKSVADELKELLAEQQALEAQIQKERAERQAALDAAKALAAQKEAEKAAKKAKKMAKLEAEKKAKEDEKRKKEEGGNHHLAEIEGGKSQPAMQRTWIDWCLSRLDLLLWLAGAMMFYILAVPSMIDAFYAWQDRREQQKLLEQLFASTEAQRAAWLKLAKSGRHVKQTQRRKRLPTTGISKRRVMVKI